MKRIINWGLIGLGNASLNIAKEFYKIDNSNLLAVASLTQDKREFFKNKFNLLSENVYPDYNKIFENKDIDIIFIGLPNTMHEEFCLKAIGCNKNLVIEKPITTNLESFEKIKKEFLKKKLLLEEGTANKFHPFYKDILKTLKNLHFSKILKIKSSFGNDAVGGKKFFGFRIKKINYKKRLFNKKLGGGSILDGGIYPVSLVVDILNLFQNNYFKDLQVLKCTKKIRNEIDLSSTIEFKINNVNIELKTSLTENLNNDLEIHTIDEIIKIENIFNISSDSFISFNKPDSIIKKNNKFIENSYFYEIEEISKILINKLNDKKDFIDNFLKIEKNILFLDKWIKY